MNKRFVILNEKKREKYGKTGRKYDVRTLDLKFLLCITSLRMVCLLIPMDSLLDYSKNSAARNRHQQNKQIKQKRLPGRWTQNDVQWTVTWNWKVGMSHDFFLIKRYFFAWHKDISVGWRYTKDSSKFTLSINITDNVRKIDCGSLAMNIPRTANQNTLV